MPSLHQHHHGWQQQVPYSYPARCAIYSFLMVLSGAVFIIAILMLTDDGCLRITETFTSTYTSQGENFTLTVSRMVFFPPLVPERDWDIEGGYMDSLEAALEPSTSVPYSYWYYIPTPYGMHVAKGVTIVLCVFGGAFFIFTWAMLGLLIRDSCRAKAVVKAAATAGETEELTPWSQQTAATGGNPYSSTPSSSQHQIGMTGREKAEQQQQQQQLTKDAKVRQALSICCLVFSVICLVMSIVGLVGIFATWSNLKQEGNDIMLKYNGTILSLEYESPMGYVTYFGHIPTVILSFVAVVLLCVPFLSGIADAPVVRCGGSSSNSRRNHQQNEDEATSVVVAGGAAALPRGGEAEGSLRTSLPLYTHAAYQNLDTVWNDRERAQGEGDVVAEADALHTKEVTV